MNITFLYKQLTEGKINKSFFMKNVRMQFPQYVSPVTSYDDAVNILKGKRIINEETISEAYEVHYSDGIRRAKKFANVKTALTFAKELISTNKQLQHVDVFKAGPNFHSTTDTNALVAWWGPGSYFDNVSKKDSSILGKQIKEETLNESHKLTTAQIIDRLNPYHFKKAVEFELSKQKEVNKDTYEKVREKVAKKMQKNPMAYEDQVFANAKDVEKKDEHLHTKEVKGGQNKDKKNEMKVKKKNEKANTRSSKKENKKGNPKGVKHMTYNAKKAKGVSSVMPMTGKEKVLEALKESLSENFGSHDYHSGKEVYTPEGRGTVKSVVGGTLTVELENGELKDFQINVVDKATRDAQFAKMPNLGSAFDKFKQDVKDESTVSQYGNIKPQEVAQIKKEVPDAEFEEENDGETHQTTITSDSKSEEDLRAILKKILMMPEMKSVVKKLKEYTKYAIGSPAKPDLQYRKASDPDLEKQLRGAGVPFTKTQG